MIFTSYSLNIYVCLTDPAPSLEMPGCVVAIVESTVRWVMFMQEKEINDAKERQIQNRIKLVGTAMKK